MKNRGNLSIFVPHAGCPHRCSFCDQNRISGQQKPPAPEQAAALCQEQRERAAKLGRCEIAFFGGSFTAVPRPYMVSLLEAVQPFLGEGGYSGIRVSTRPDAVSGETLELLRRYHVTAVELGAQSMSDAVLSRNGRGHSAQDVREASRRIQAMGMELGLQMMTGLPGSTLELDRDTARNLSDLHPDTVRIYPAVALEGTLMADWVRDGSYSPPSLEDTVELCADLIESFRLEGITVLRAGLPAGRELERSILAGPYHPAFGELCESRIYRRKLERLVGNRTGTFLVQIPRRDWSKAAGHKKANLLWFAQRGVTLRLTAEEASPSLPESKDVCDVFKIP